MSNVHLAGKGGGGMRVPYVVRALQVKVWGHGDDDDDDDADDADDDDDDLSGDDFREHDAGRKWPAAAAAAAPACYPILPVSARSILSQADLEAENSKLKSTIANLRQGTHRQPLPSYAQFNLTTENPFHADAP
jgi:hypothetical protein